MSIQETLEFVFERETIPFVKQYVVCCSVSNLKHYEERNMERILSMQFTQF